MANRGFALVIASAVCGFLISCSPSSDKLGESPDAPPSSDYALFQTSVLMKLAHHVAAERAKPIANVPIRSYMAIRQGAGHFGKTKVEATTESTWFSADNGTNLFVLLRRPTWTFLNPFVPRYKLVCMKPDGSVLWQSESTEVQALERIVPVPDGIVLTRSNGAICNLISNKGKIRKFPCPPNRAVKSCSLNSNPDQWLGEGELYHFDWTRFPRRQPSVESVKEWVDEGRCFWFTADHAYSATYAREKINEDAIVTEINLETGATTDTPIFKWNGNSKGFITEPKRRILGLFGRYVVWAEEVESGLRIHKTPLDKNEKSRSIDVKEDVRSYLQLTMDGKIFFRNEDKPQPRSANYKNEWLFLANVVRMDRKADPEDIGVQTLWIGHPKRKLGTGKIISIDTRRGGR